MGTLGKAPLCPTPLQLRPARREVVFGAKLFSVVPSDRTRGNGHKQAQEVPSEHEEELLPSEGDGALEQAAQGGCGVSSGDIQDLPGRSPVQPALGDPAWAGRLD